MTIELWILLACFFVAFAMMSVIIAFAFVNNKAIAKIINASKCKMRRGK